MENIVFLKERGTSILSFTNQRSTPVIQAIQLTYMLFCLYNIEESRCATHVMVIFHSDYGYGINKANIFNE